jgi:hypothetical protein
MHEWRDGFVFDLYANGLAGKKFGMRRQSEAATALWITCDFGLGVNSLEPGAEAQRIEK